MSSSVHSFLSSILSISQSLYGWLCFYSSPAPHKSQVHAVNSNWIRSTYTHTHTAWYLSFCLFSFNKMVFSIKISNRLSVAVLRIRKCHFSFQSIWKCFAACFLLLRQKKKTNKIEWTKSNVNVNCFSSEYIHFYDVSFEMCVFGLFVASLYPPFVSWVVLLVLLWLVFSFFFSVQCRLLRLIR